MKLENLISMREYVLECYEEIQNSCVFENNCFNYANFLSQKLEIWQFTACKLVDGVWVVLEEPEWWHRYQNGASPFMNFDEIRPCQEYQKAKEKCLVDGFAVEIMKFNNKPYKAIKNKDTYIFFYDELIQKWTKVNDYNNIEDLILYNLKLTATAQKQL